VLASRWWQHSLATWGGRKPCVLGVLLLAWLRGLTCGVTLRLIGNELGFFAFKNSAPCWPLPLLPPCLQRSACSSFTCFKSLPPKRECVSRSYRVRSDRHSVLFTPASCHQHNALHIGGTTDASLHVCHAGDAHVGGVGRFYSRPKIKNIGCAVTWQYNACACCPARTQCVKVVSASTA
jgi:hypothetical protein